MIGFCITCKGREQHLKQTLPRNLADNVYFQDHKFIVLDYGSPYDLREYVKTYELALDRGDIVFYSFPEAGPFKMAHAKNMAHRCAMLEGCDILVNLDADNFTGPNFAQFLSDKFQEPNIFMWTRVRPLDGSEKLPRGCSGRIAVRAQDFLKVGGYDEKYDTWGPDDKDFNARLRLLGLNAREIHRDFIGIILHNDKMRFKEYKHVRDNCDSSEFAVNPQSPIANFGRFGMGTVYRNFSDAPIELGRLPTRIFGIGMHKTATTSLHHALEILGYDSAHWKSAHWAKAIWREMNTLGRSPALEKSYALCDLPITLLYEQLDRAYPGSTFILTVRNEDLWIKTVEAHWNPKYNPFRAGWDSDPFTNRIHQVLYGRSDFDRKTMLARYRKHNNDATEYFRGRANDFLTMDMTFGWPYRNDAGAGWPELCGFLRKPIPRVPYPKAFASY